MNLLQTLERHPLAGIVKAGLMTAGYAAAFGTASLVVYAHVALTDSAEASAASGMYAFGDSLLFLGVFSVAAILPTAAALRWLRHWQGLWPVLAMVALSLAATAVAALAIYEISLWIAPAQGSTVAMLSGLSVLRLLLTPILAGAFLLCALLAPTPETRKRLFRATSAEAIVCAIIVLHWFARMPG